MSAGERYVRYRAPAEDRQTMCVPPWDQVGALLDANLAKRASLTVEVQGRALDDLALVARREVLAQALAYTRGYADIRNPAFDAPLIITGHQPELVHPGVWLKDFAAARIAGQAGGTALSLIIDSDLCRSPSIRVPTGTLEQPRVENVAYDEVVAQMPLEERRIVDPRTWETFGTRVAKTVEPFVTSPLVSEWWPSYACTGGPKNVGLSIAQARHRLELEWGIRNLNLPQSCVCQTSSFRWFAVHLLSHAGRFRDAYNDALGEYRRVHRLRSRAQPLPDLTSAEGFQETPFWIWTVADPQRRALFAKRQPRAIELTDKAGFERLLPLAPEDEVSRAIEALAEWESQGIKIRTRALITTMFARLVLADLFIHGIGGAKYDQVTDGICQRFFGVQPPDHLTLSGTLKLPIARTALPGSRQYLQQEIRRLEFHPETEVGRLTLGASEQAAVNELVARKLTWVRTPKTQTNASQRHQQIVEANEALQGWLVARRLELDSTLAETTQYLRASQLLESREYPFCLFPQEHLRKFLLDF